MPSRPLGSSTSPSMSIRTHILPALLLVLAVLPLLASASSGDRNPTFQHCLKGCSLTYCDPSQPPIPLYLRAFGWTCEANCKYSCSHSFTDNIRPGSQWHQFYGKWPFYRLGPFQEPASVLMSLGNLYVNLKGIGEVKRRVRPENRLRGWLLALGWVQVNTWVWSAIFHTRDTPTTEKLDYFSATVTIAFGMLHAILRIFGLLTPMSSSRLVVPVSAGVAFVVISHWTYLLSFPAGRFPYGYHTKFALMLGMVHNVVWCLWSASFYITLPSFHVLGREIRWPRPYPSQDPLKHRTKEALVPLTLVMLTMLAMSFELLDFPPMLRMIDAHAIWHAATIPLALAWWTFFVSDAIEYEGSMLNSRGVSGEARGADAKMPLSGGGSSSGKPLSNGSLSGNGPVPTLTLNSEKAGSDGLLRGETAYETPKAQISGFVLSHPNLPTRSRSPGVRED